MARCALLERSMIVVDLDNTLLHTGGSVSRRTARALEAVRRRGHVVVFATGRPVRQVSRIARDAGHEGYCLCSNGAVLTHTGASTPVRRSPFDPGALAVVIATARALDPGIRLAVETSAGLFAEPGFPAVDPQGGVPAVEDVAGEVLQLLVAGGGPALAGALRAACPDAAEIFQGTPDGPLELTARGVDKGIAAAALAGRLGIGREAVVAFGDMPNDLPLLRWAGTAYAMANAHPDVLAAVPGRAPHHDADGVAVVLEELLAASRPREPTTVTSPFVLSVAVMTHDRRRAEAEALRDRYPELAIEVVLDPDPDGPPMAMRSARAAWSSVRPGASHHVVLQDDIVACPGFRDALHDVVAAAPRSALSLFAEWGSRAATSIRFAAMNGHAFAAVTNNYIPTQALVLPADVARGFDPYVRTWEPDATQDDLAMARYLERIGVEARLTVPSLVEHSETTSLVGNDYMGLRLAACFAEHGVGSLPWDGAVFWPAYVPFFCGRTERALCLVVDGTRRENWRTRSAGQVLARLGHTPMRVRADLHAALSSGAATRDITEQVTPGHLRECWTTAYAMGAVFAAQWRPGTDQFSATEAWESALGQPWAAAAISTTAHGALRSFAPAEIIPMVQDVLEVGMRAAFVAGVRRRAAIELADQVV